VKSQWPDQASRNSRPGVEARVARALARRRELISTGTARVRQGDAPYTDAVRLVHGEADGLPGLALDRLGGLLRILLTGLACEPLLERVVDAVLGGLADEIARLRAPVGLDVGAETHGEIAVAVVALARARCACSPARTISPKVQHTSASVSQITFATTRFSCSPARSRASASVALACAASPSES